MVTQANHIAFLKNRYQETVTYFLTSLQFSKTFDLIRYDF